MSTKSSSVNADGIFEPFEVDAVPYDDYSKGERFGVRLTGEGYRKSATMEYWEAEEIDDKP